MANPYDIDLDRNPANYQPLTPLSFLERAAAVFPDAHRDHPRHRCARTYARVLRAHAPARLGAGAARHRPRRHGLGDARQHAGDARGHYGVPMTRRRAQHAQHPARCRDHRLHARPRRDQGADHRPRILRRSMKEALALAKVKPLVIDYDDPEYSGAGRAARRDRLRGVPRGRRSRTSPGACRTTNGTRSRSTTPPAPPATPRASSTTIAARICSRIGNVITCAHGASIRSICGRCRCSTATAGASRGRSRWSPARMSACAGARARRCTTRSPTTGSRICAARRS